MLIGMLLFIFVFFVVAEIQLDARVRNLQKAQRELKGLLLVSRDDAIALCWMWAEMGREIRTRYLVDVVLNRQCQRADGHWFVVESGVKVDDEFTLAQLQARFYRACEELTFKEEAYAKRGERMPGVFDGRV